jgi:hypothetical protein
MDLLQKQASNRRLNFIERQYVLIFIFHVPSIFFISSEERTKALQYILYQREQIDQLLIEKQSVSIFFFDKTIYSIV